MDGNAVVYATCNEKAVAAFPDNHKEGTEVSHSVAYVQCLRLPMRETLQTESQGQEYPHAGSHVQNRCKLVVEKMRCLQKRLTNKVSIVPQ